MFTMREDKYAYWRGIMRQYEASGKSQEEFCKLNQLSFRKFKYYRYRFQQKTKKVQVEQPMLVPVKLSETTVPIESSKPARCDIYLPNGLHLTFSQNDLTKTTARFIKEFL